MKTENSTKVYRVVADYDKYIDNYELLVGVFTDYTVALQEGEIWLKNTLAKDAEGDPRWASFINEITIEELTLNKVSFGKVVAYVHKDGTVDNRG